MTQISYFLNGLVGMLYPYLICIR